MAYINLPAHNEAPRCFRRRIYTSLHIMALTLKGSWDIRIMTPWPKVWRNLHAVWSSEDIWFMVIHDLIPTNDRLAKIQRREPNQCPHCDQPDALIHRLTECSDGTDIWRWTRFRIAIILCTDPQHIQPEWTVRPSFHFWLPQRHRSISWILAHMVYYRIQHRNLVSSIDYADFMQRARWKAYHTARRWKRVGNYLEIL